MNKLARTKLGTTMMKPPEAAQLPRDKTRCPHIFLVSGCVTFHQKYHIHPKLSKNQMWKNIKYLRFGPNLPTPQIKLIPKNLRLSATCQLGLC